ncbi:MAG: ribonuclease P protein component [Bacteriovoracaceae bacterium]|nr:ribonuclease P protein component [Bacteriovoracaceae bacterium]
MKNKKLLKNSETYGKEHRLLRSGDFNNLKYKRSLIRKKYLIVYYKDTLVSANNTRIGISVSKKVGKACFRNRLKRIIREGFRLSDCKFSGKDVLFVVSTRNKIKEIGEFKRMLQEILREVAS